MFPTLVFIFLNIYLLICSHDNTNFFQVAIFPTKILYAFRISPIHVQPVVAVYIHYTNNNNNTSCPV
jgi:hypothetical protein